MRLVAAAVACGAIWDFITTFVGLGEMFDVFSQEGDYPFLQLLFSLVVACVIMGFVLCTHYLWNIKDSDMITVMLKATWFICFVFDVWTALLGNRRFIFGGKPDDVKVIIGVGVVTLIMTSSTILLSRMIGEHEREQQKVKEKEAEEAKDYLF
jgi:hypothetical protein